MAKMFEDALRSLGILEEDDPSHVKRAIIEVTKLGKEERPAPVLESGQEANSKDRDWLEIEIKTL